MDQPALNQPQQSEKLTDQERKDFERAKFFIRDAGAKMLRYVEDVKARKLWREDYATFDAFCHEVVGVTRQRLSQLFAAEEVNELAVQLGLKPLSERAAREVVPLNTVQRVTVLMSTAHAFPDQDITSTMLKASKEKLGELATTGGTVDVGDGTNTALDAAIVNEVAERLARQREYIKAGRARPTAVLEGQLVTNNDRFLTFTTPQMQSSLLYAGTVRIVVYRLTYDSSSDYWPEFDKGNRYEVYKA